MHFNLEKSIEVETNGSNYVFAGIKYQSNDQGTLYPVAFFSKNHSPVECNYKIYGKELLAVI